MRGPMHLNVLRGSLHWAAQRSSVCLPCGQPVTTAAARKHVKAGTHQVLAAAA
jgi:hypothetical protein